MGLKQRRADTYEIKWKNGDVNVVSASQISWSPDYGSGLYGMSQTKLMHFHSMVDDKWTLLLSVNESEVLSIKNLDRLSFEVPEHDYTFSRVVF